MPADTVWVLHIFTTLLHVRLGVVADVGQTYNASVTYQHLVADKPDVRFLSLEFQHLLECSASPNVQQIPACPIMTWQAASCSLWPHFGAPFVKKSLIC